MKLSNRAKSSHRRQGNHQTRNSNEDDNCSVICYKDSNSSHIGVVRIRQQIKCSACNITRGTLTSYGKHLMDNHHRENVKKLCDENCFKPSVYDQAMYLAFENNFYYQSENFHFRYQRQNDENNSTENSTVNFSNNQRQSKILKKQRTICVTLNFQKKTYSKIGIANSQIREELLQQMLNDRSDDLAKMTKEIFYTKKKSPSEDKHQQAQENFVISSSLVKEDGQVTLKNEQSQIQISFDNGRSSSEMKNDENDVEQKSAPMITDKKIEIEKIDRDEQSSLIDDVTNVCKELLDEILTEIYSNTDQFKREMKFYSLIARRNSKKKTSSFCDLCSTILSSEKISLQHLNSEEHLKKFLDLQNEILPWRREMQKAIFQGKTLKETMGGNQYDEYKKTMGFFLAPEIIRHRGRFCCAFCESIFSDQWSLEKHLHSETHRERRKSIESNDHKQLVVNFANASKIPLIYKLNGVNDLSQIPDDIKTRNHFQLVTKEKLDKETNDFLRFFPFDEFEGATSIVENKKSNRKSTKISSTSNGIRFQRNNSNRIKTNNSRSTNFQNSNRISTTKRSIGVCSVPVNKRFRSDLTNKFANVEQQFSSNNNFNSRPSNGNDQWTRNSSFDQSIFELRSIASNNNSFYNDRPTPLMSPRNFISPSTNFDRSLAKPPPLLPTPFGHPSNQESLRTFSHDCRPPLMSTPINHQNSFISFNGNQSNQRSNSFFSQTSGTSINDRPIHSFGDFRGSIGNPRDLIHSNSTMVRSSRSLNECFPSNFNQNSPNSYAHFGAPFVDRPETNFDRFGYQNPSASHSSWNPRTTIDGNDRFQSINKPVAPNFPYSNNSYSHSNNFLMSGQNLSRDYIHRP